MANKKIVNQEKEAKEYVSIAKLLCDFATYYRERTKCKLPIVEKCQKCGTKFSENDSLYTAIDDKNKKEIICEKCSKE